MQLAVTVAAAIVAASPVPASVPRAIAKKALRATHLG
jgi:hypothetical protein